METKKILILLELILIVTLAGFLRLYNLDNNPNGLYVDEATTGYNAWSILETGKDEYGKQFPLAFRFLGSYTPPLYTYLTAQVISVLGLSVYAIRFLSALAGIIMVPLFFILLKKLNLIKDEKNILYASLLFAITPWAIFFSRIGYEVNLAFFLFSIGVLLLWQSIKNNYLLVVAAFLLGLSADTYHSERLLSPLLLIVSVIIFRKIFWKRKNLKILVISLLLYSIAVIPQIIIIFTPANTTRGLGTFYFKAISNQVEISNLPPPVSWPVSISYEFLSQYLSYFSPRNLFFQPDSDPQRSYPELSVFYPWMVVLYLIGIVVLTAHRNQLNSKFTIMLLLVCPIPAALTGDPFSTQRALPLLLPLMVVMSLGLEKVLSSFKFWPVILAVMISFSLITLYRSGAVLFPNERAAVWGYGFSQLASEIQKRPNEKFVIDTSRMKPAYIELAFYLKVSPQEVQNSVDQNIKNNYYHNTKWDSHYELRNFETRQLNFEKDVYKPQILVGDELSISDSQAAEHFLEKVFEIKDPLGQVIFKGYRSNPKKKCQTSSSKYCQNM